MTRKISIELTEHQVALAETQMRLRGHDTLSDYIAALIEKQSVIADIAGVTRLRREVPDEDWLNQEQFWKEYDQSREARTKK